MTAVPVVRDDWRALAACRGSSELFWAPQGELAPARHTRELAALALCAQCPSREPCRAFGREHREPGIWGGETAEQRAHAGFRPVATGEHLDREVRRRLQAEQELAAIVMRDVPLATLEQIARLARAVDPEGDPR